MSDNRNLHAAKRNKQDEFYTQLSDIENELRFYKDHFRGKTVFCNCDDPYESNFFKYFALHFNSLGLKRLIATGYVTSPVAGKELALFDDEADTPKNQPYVVFVNEVTDINGDGRTDLSDVALLLRMKKNTRRKLHGDSQYPAGDFRSAESIALLKQADIVVTNPPFSLFREYVSQLMEYQKQFLIIGNVNSIVCKEIFPLIKDGKLWLGASIHSGDRKFYVPDTYPLQASGCGVEENGRKFIRVKGVRWYTNLDYKQRHEDLILYRRYSPLDYPTYDNYNAVNVDKTKDIPCDYDGVMGVPVTFIDKFSPGQFEIVGITDRQDTYGFRHHKYTVAEYQNANDLNAGAVLLIHGKPKAVYARILIKRKSAS